MRSPDATIALAPILQALRNEAPDWKAIANALFDYLDFAELPTLIKGRQDWQSIAQYLLDCLGDRDPNYQRILLILEHLDEHPKDCPGLAELTGLDSNTVRQTILALIKGSYEIEEELSGGSEGRPRKAFWRSPDTTKQESNGRRL